MEGFKVVGEGNNPAGLETEEEMRERARQRRLGEKARVFQCPKPNVVGLGKEGIQQPYLSDLFNSLEYWKARGCNDHVKAIEEEIERRRVKFREETGGKYEEAEQRVFAEREELPEEEIILNYSVVGGPELQVIKSKDEHSVRHKGRGKIAVVPSEKAGRAFVSGGVDRCIDVMSSRSERGLGPENLEIKKRKFFLVKNEAGSILARASEKEVAESYIKGYGYCVKNRLWETQRQRRR